MLRVREDNGVESATRLINVSRHTAAASGVDAYPTSHSPPSNPVGRHDGVFPLAEGKPFFGWHPLRGHHGNGCARPHHLLARDCGQKERGGRGTTVCEAGENSACPVRELAGRPCGRVWGLGRLPTNQKSVNAKREQKILSWQLPPHNPGLMKTGLLLLGGYLGADVVDTEGRR